jgi:hypothetical protein
LIIRVNASGSSITHTRMSPRFVRAITVFVPPLSVV